MSKKYDKYLTNHFNAVVSAYNWFAEYIPEIIDKANSVGEDVNVEYQITIEHDRTKYECDEYYAYDDYFYGRDKSEKVEEKFNRAWLAHIHKNPHHWQHWVLHSDDKLDGTIILDMPYNYILEMICDWWSFSWISGDLMEIFDWYESHDNIMLSEKTRNDVNEILSEMRRILSYNRNRKEN